MLIYIILTLTSSVLSYNTQSYEKHPNNECIKLTQRRYLDSLNNSCEVSNCHDCTSNINSCQLCSSGYSIQNSFCCPEKCISCTLDSYCLECTEGFTAKDGFCIKCPDNCSSCDINSFCFACYEGYIMDVDEPCKNIKNHDYTQAILASCFGAITFFISVLY